MFGKAGIGGLMQQAQKMQENMKKAQAELAQTPVQGQAGNGLVKITATCNHVIHKIDINTDLIAQAVDDKEMLEDLILAALTDVYQQAEDLTAERMSEFTAGLPAGVGNFFK